MRLERLLLRNYRNYPRLDLTPAAGLNVFLGRNAQGKTNLLESVAMVALSSSPRARRELELVGPLGAEARIEATVEASGRQHTVRMIVPGGAVEGLPARVRARRRIEVDGVARRAVELPGLFRVVLFWPDDLSLAKSGPEHRRRLLNQMLVQIEPGYAGTLARYTRVVEQRNHLLKQIAAREQALDALEVWDLELLSTGAAIVRARAAVVEDLRRRAAQTHARIAPGEMLEVGYVAPPGDLAGALAAARPEDLRRGVTTIGPHRDDLLIALEGRETRAYASQGQQRTAVVSIKLAEARVIESRSGEAPVLLLDDVLSELDAGRRAALLEQLMASGQVIITSVEAEPFPPEVMHRARVSHIEEGRILADD